MMSAFDLSPLTQAQRAARIQTLNHEEAHVLLRQGTEAPFCGVFLDTKEQGVYVCRLCGLPLFDSGSKFDSKTGWPSFFIPFHEEHIHQSIDTREGRQRMEILCGRCQSHLGHVFSDGPAPTGRRYCLNSIALEFVRKGHPFPDYLQRKGAESACA